MKGTVEDSNRLCRGENPPTETFPILAVIIAMIAAGFSAWFLAETINAVTQW